MAKSKKLLDRNIVSKKQLYGLGHNGQFSGIIDDFNCTLGL